MGAGCTAHLRAVFYALSYNIHNPDFAVFAARLKTRAVSLIQGVRRRIAWHTFDYRAR